VVGYAGLLDLGYAAFFAVGAYSVGILTTTFGWNFWATIPVAMTARATCEARWSFTAYLVSHGAVWFKLCRLRAKAPLPNNLAVRRPFPYAGRSKTPMRICF